MNITSASFIFHQLSINNSSPNLLTSPTSSTPLSSQAIMATEESNSLITTKAADAALHVQLHPLVLLTITDYITRHISRQQKEPIVGAIIGQQNGRNFTLEHAYECRTEIRPDGAVGVDEAWFLDRLEQYKDVHKVPALDLVAVFMLGSVNGPVDAHAGLVKQVQTLTSTDSLMLLLFHAELVDQLQGGKLPITLYESVEEQHEGASDGEIKFRELAYEVETGEAEMIGVDFVATGGGNATAVPKADTTAAPSSTQEAGSSKDKDKDKKTKGKGKAKDQAGEDADSENATSALSAEDEELIASLTAKSNAIKMLNTRLNLIRSYLQTLPPSYLTDASSTEAPAGTTNYTLLRSINAMLSRLPLLAPPTMTSETTTQDAVLQPSSLTSAAEKEKQDVHLSTLLATLTRSISEAQTMGMKFSIVNREKTAKERSPFGTRGRGGMGFGDESALLAGDNGAF